MLYKMFVSMAHRRHLGEVRRIDTHHVLTLVVKLITVRDRSSGDCFINNPVGQLSRLTSPTNTRPFVSFGAVDMTNPHPASTGFLDNNVL